MSLLSCENGWRIARLVVDRRCAVGCHLPKSCLGVAAKGHAVGTATTVPVSLWVCSMLRGLRSLEGRAIVSLHDHPEIRHLFIGFDIESVSIQYTAGGGKGGERRELIIFNWDDAAEPAGLF
ncbi:putative dNA adenine methylase [Burkholderia pseudomallei MSHR5613]|nr:putative dNA adenine methylase [Burkholderia pseudomallei MSHR5613]